MKKYQEELFNKLAAYCNNDITLTMSMGRQTGKSRFTKVWLDEYGPKFIVLEDQWEIPNHKRIDVKPEIARWIEEQDISQWKWESNGPYDDRYVITPELLTLLQLKWS